MIDKDERIGRSSMEGSKHHVVFLRFISFAIILSVLFFLAIPVFQDSPNCNQASPGFVAGPYAALPLPFWQRALRSSLDRIIILPVWIFPILGFLFTPLNRSFDLSGFFYLSAAFIFLVLWEVVVVVSNIGIMRLRSKGRIVFIKLNYINAFFSLLLGVVSMLLVFTSLAPKNAAAVSYLYSSLVSCAYILYFSSSSVKERFSMKAAVEFQAPDRKKKIKRIIAREGLIIFGLLAIGLPVVLYSEHLKRKNAWLFSEERKEFLRNISCVMDPRGYRFPLIELFGLICLLYLIVRFIIWAVRVLRQKE